jgi:hypothetical protein
VKVADRGDDRDRRERVHAGDGHQPGHHRVAERLGGEFLADGGELAGVEVQLAQQCVDGGPLIGEQRLAACCAGVIIHARSTADPGKPVRQQRNLPPPVT